ncbi:type II toxin-antitoxin system HicA family toxin [Bradyrhizobium sp.]|nr:type II toxin-antitoxin system HicA family toxin [Bradyrhizobium sp.]
MGGWRHIGATGSHRHYKHPTKSGKVTVPHPEKGTCIQRLSARSTGRQD